METAPATPTLLDRMNAAIGSVGVVEKDKTNPHFRYDYLSEEAVKKIAARACKEHRIAPKTISFTIVESIMVERPKGEEHRVTMCCTLTWEDGVSAEGYGCGMDPADKAIMKAQTSAIREAWKNRLCIATGNDPEADAETDERSQPDRDAPPQQNREREPEQERPRAASNGNGRRDSRAPSFPYGRCKGKLLTDPSVAVKDLQWMADQVTGSLRDPSKAQYHDANKRLLEALQIEILRRERDDAAPPAHSDDDIPF